MKLSLVEHLRCPVDASSLILVDAVTDASGEILSGRLTSAAGRTYEIRDGVPIVLVPEEWSSEQIETRNSFSEKWHRATNYREATMTHYRDWYLQRYGFESIENVAKFLQGKTRILDAATGHGRDAQLYAENTSATVFGIDFSSGIFNAYRDLSGLINLHLIQADMLKLPFPTNYFDFVACDQALHHTPDTRQAFHTLLRYVAPGGHFATYVYRKKGPIREFTDDYIRKFTVEMTSDECVKVARGITQFGKALSDLNVEFELPEDIEILGFKKGRYNLQRFIYYNIMKCYWNNTMDFASNEITNFDWYHPRHAHRHTPDEVRQWCDEAGVIIEHFDVCDAGISVIVKKPLE